MAADNLNAARNIVDKAKKAALVAAKRPLSRQPKTSNDFVAALSSSLQENTRALHF